MKRSIIRNIILFPIAFALMLSGCAETKGDVNVNDSESVSLSDSEEISESAGEIVEDGRVAIFEDGKCLYKNVIYSIDASDDELAAATSVFNALRELTSSVKLKSDYNHNSSKEIVVALSSAYPEVAPLKEGLRYNDYVICESGNKLVVTANTLEGLEAGASKLLRMIVSGAGKEITNLYINEVRYESVYKLSSFTVSGNDVKDYVIVYPKVSRSGDIDHYESAKQWQNLIGMAYGCTLTITDDSAAAVDKEILIGSTNREESAEYIAPLHYNMRVSGLKLVVNCGGLYSHGKLISIFSGTYISGKTEVALGESTVLSGDLLTEPELARTADTDLRIMASNILCEGVNWNSTGKILPVQPRVEIFLANLYAYRPDVVAVTETSQLWAENLKAHLGKGYKLILSEFEDGSANFSAIIYNSETLTLEGSGLVRYSKTDGSGWCRNMSWGEFTVRSTGKEFAFISTHWDVIYPQNIEQADEFNAKIVELSKGGTRPVMTGGDMNVRVDGVNYQRLMEYGNVNNAKLVTTNLRNDIATCKDIFVPAGDDPVKTIDHIFLTKDVECTMFMTVVENSTIDLSDHNGIMADVKF